jgi:hypothetical protein
MRLPLYLLALAGLTFTPEAHAGGVGVLGTVGMRSDTVYFYDSANDMAQYRQSQTLPAFGTGIEFVLGDRDDKITGVFRGYWLQDAAQKDPATITTSVNKDDVVSAYNDEPRNLGMGSFGVHWGFLGTPDKFMVNFVTAAGSGFLTDDHTEFLMVQGGAGATYRFGRSFQAYADVDYTLRYRKSFTHGAGMYAGVRYLFD